MRVKGLIIMMWVVGCLGHAQDLYTLEKCKEMALQNNTKAQNSRLSLYASEHTKKEAFTNYFPSVSVIGAGFRANKAIMDMSAMTEGLTQIMMALVEQGILDPAALSGGSQKTEMFEKGLIGAVMAVQPVFTGGQIYHGNKLAKLGVEAMRLQEAMSHEEIVIAVEQYFWQIIALEEKLKTIAEAENLLLRVHTDVKNAVEAGIVNRNDLLKVELKQNELESGKLKLTNGLMLLKIVLAQFIGAPSEGFDIDKTLIDNVILAFDAGIDHSSALNGRVEYRLLDKSIEAGALQVKMEIGKYLPTVAVGVGWNAFQFDKGSPLAMDKNFGMAFATVAVPVSDWWGGSHAIKKQKIQLKIAENEKRNAAELMLIQMQQLRNEVEEAIQQVHLADQAIASALENVRLNTDYYQAGTGLLIDLLDAQTTLQQTRDQRTEALTLYCITLAKYRQTTGQ